MILGQLSYCTLEEHFDMSSVAKGRIMRVMLNPTTQSICTEYHLFLGYISLIGLSFSTYRYLSCNKYKLFLVYDNDYLGWIPPEADSEIRFQGLVFNLGDDTRKHRKEVGKSGGKGKEANKRCVVKAFLRALVLCLKGGSGICWITCL